MEHVTAWVLHDCSAAERGVMLGVRAVGYAHTAVMTSGLEAVAALTRVEAGRS